MADNKLLAMIFKSGDDYSVWYADIPKDEPFLVALLDKYANDGGSIRGTKEDVIDDLKENLR